MVFEPPPLRCVSRIGIFFHPQNWPEMLSSDKPSIAALGLRRAACCVFALLLGLLPATATRANSPAARPTAQLSAADVALLDAIEHEGFRFFVEQAHIKTGLVRDRARADGSSSPGKASISASGFAFSAWVIAADRGWVGRETAMEHIRQSLQFLVHHAARQHGFFYHFLEMDTGARAWQCEVSSIDTSLLLAGAIVAREYFNDPGDHGARQPAAR